MNCAGCNSELEDVYKDRPGEYNQYEDAMDLTLDPGYGERFDGNIKIRFFICGKCSDKIFKVIPMLRKHIEDNLFL